MAWSTPLTAVANATLTAAQWNASVRDNLLETAPAKITAAGQIFVGTGANAGAARQPTGAIVTTGQTTSSATYTNLATVGPQITVTTGTRAICLYAVDMTNNTIGHYSAAAIDVTGATTIAVNDSTAIRFEPGTANGVSRIGAMAMFSPEGGNALTAGSNTFTLKYRVQVGTDTGTFSQRHLAVIPL